MTDVEAPSPPALDLRGFSLAYRVSGGGLRTVFEGVDLRLEVGKSYAVVGPSGSGKSTLIRLLTGLWDSREAAPRMTGRAAIFGHAIVAGHPAALRGMTTAVLQDEGLLDELSPRANVRLALRAAGRSPKMDLALLAQAGLPEPPADVASLSGGMRKRVAVARALAAAPRLCLFDEPTAGLDPASARDIAGLLRQTHDTAVPPRTTLVVTHDLATFAPFADAVLVLDPEHGRMRLEAPDIALARLGADGSAASVKGRGTEVDGDELPGLEPLRNSLLGVAAAVATFAEAIRRLPPVYPELVGRTAVRFVLESVAFASLGSGVIGGLATYFALRNNPLEGAFLSQVLTGSGKVLAAVLVPLLVGFFFTARIAAGAAARVGTMTRTNQVAALRLMGIRPADFLLTPMLWAMVLALPLVTAAGVVFAALASLFAASLVAGTSVHGWATAFFATVDLRDLQFGLLKTVISGFLVAMLTFHLGTGPKRSGQDVGTAVNGAIVGGMVLVLLVHGSATLLQF